MDGMYAECSVKRAGSIKIIMLKALVVAAVLMCFFFAAITSNKILFVIGIILACLVVWFWPMFGIEWEYIFVDGQLDFDTIAGGEKRKTRLRIDFEQVEVVAPLGSHALDRYSNIRQRDYSSLRKGVKKYVVVTKVDEQGLNKICFEPSEKMLSMMKEKAPGKVIIE